MCISFNHTQDFQWNVLTSKAQLVEKDWMFLEDLEISIKVFFFGNSNMYVCICIYMCIYMCIHTHTHICYTYHLIVSWFLLKW